MVRQGNLNLRVVMVEKVKRNNIANSQKNNVSRASTCLPQCMVFIALRLAGLIV
jgi:hypothetical protein